MENKGYQPNIGSLFPHKKVVIIRPLEHTYSLHKFSQSSGKVEYILGKIYKDI